MKPKLIELAEILKQKPEIKERLERLTFGCILISDYEDEKWVELKLAHYNRALCIKWDMLLWYWEIKKIIGHEPAYHDVLEYLGEEYYLSFDCISHIDDQDYYDEIIKLSLWPLSDQSDETLDEIISLCKNHAQ